MRTALLPSAIDRRTLIVLLGQHESQRQNVCGSVPGEHAGAGPVTATASTATGSTITIWEVDRHWPVCAGARSVSRQTLSNGGF